MAKLVKENRNKPGRCFNKGLLKLLFFTAIVLILFSIVAQNIYVQSSVGLNIPNSIQVEKWESIFCNIYM